MRALVFLLTLSLAAAFASEVLFESDSDSGESFVLERLHKDKGVIWSLEFLDESTILYTQRRGEAGVLDLATGTAAPLQGLPAIKSDGQGGLLDAGVSPGFQRGGWIYFTYVADQNGRGVTVLARAKLRGKRLQEWQTLLRTDSGTDTDRHFGSRIAFDNKGYLYFGVGDRGVRPNAQDLSNHAGTLMRLHLDGSIPKDNPFVREGGAKDAIYSYGHRNPQGLFYDNGEDTLWEIEHGPRGGDEINIIKKGANYGWPEISYGKEYWAPFPVGEEKKAGMEQPWKYYDPSIAPGSLLRYSGKAFKSWEGNLFAGALVLRHLNRVVVDDNLRPAGEERLLKEYGQRIRDVIEGPKGYLYLSTDSGEILRLRPQ